MKKRSDKQIETCEAHAKTGGDGADALLKCEDIQSMLFAYMSRELGDVQSVVVREHIRKCESCRAEAAEIEATLALLHQTSNDDPAHAPRLTDERRERILRAVFHPVIDWVDMHHRLVSAVLAAVVLVAAFFFLRSCEVFKREPLEEGIPIWRMFKSGELPALVEKGLRDSDPAFDPPIPREEGEGGARE
jgi:hypothetical protein